MKFHSLVAIFAILALALQANAKGDGTLRRTLVAQNEITNTDYQPETSQGVVIMNTNTNTNSNEAQAAAQPVTVVEAAPVQDSRAENLRRARQGAEVQTEQKIVEKLEDSRLQDERNRAERLFGDRLDPQPAPVQQAPVYQAPVAPVAPVMAAPVVVEEEKPTQVTIEKVEIIHPAAPAVEMEKAEVAESKMEMPEEKGASRYFVGATLGTIGYDASNVESNHALGVSIGSIMATNWGVEGSFLYSNHFVDTFWEGGGLYRELNQMDFGVAAKYYFINAKLKPYLGASANYIYRSYEGRIKTGTYGSKAANVSEETTDAVNVGGLAGIEFEAASNVLIGAGLEYNRNLFNKSLSYSTYGLPDNTRALEEIDYYSIKVGAKMTF